MLAEAWNINAGSYVLTVTVPDERGALVTAAKEITRFTDIANVISLNLDPTQTHNKQILFTLPASADQALSVDQHRHARDTGLRLFKQIKFHGDSS